MSVYQVEEIYQKDNHSFTIKWSDGIEKNYRLSDLQKKCPCANCWDEVTREQKVDPNMVNDDVKAKKITSVGRYGLRVQFSEGCSLGIYGFDQMRKDFS